MIAEITPYLHYATVGTTIVVTSLGVCVGEGIASLAALRAVNIQPAAHSEINRIAVIGMALTETSAILGLALSIILLVAGQHLTVVQSIAQIGVACAISLSGCLIGIACAAPIRQACLAVARQPFFSQKILTFLLISLSLLQTPIIFGFIIAMIIRNQIENVTSLTQAVRLLASGLSIGLGVLGPTIGLAWFSQAACKSIGFNRQAYSKIMSFSFLSQALIETPILFSLIISLLLATGFTHATTSAQAVGFISAALCIGIGTLAPGISSGRTAAHACIYVARNPAIYGTLSQASMFAQGLIETSAIYALLISLILLFLT